MARYNLEVQSYKVQVGRRWDGMASNQAVFGPAYIVCNAADGWTLVVYFMDPTSPQAANTVYLPTKRVTLFVPPDRYPMFIDVLRNEKPVYASFDSDHPEWTALSTGNEPVGEHDVITV